MTQIKDPAGELVVSADAAVMNHVAEEIGAITEDKGFRLDWHNAENSAQHANVVGTKLALIHEEVSEALGELRKHGISDTGMIPDESNIGEELADAVIRLFDLAHMLGIPIGDAVVRKVIKNADRPYMHGKKF